VLRKPKYAAVEAMPLFATPLVVFDVPDAPAVNKDLRRVIAEREKAHSSTRKTNLGGGSRAGTGPLGWGSCDQASGTARMSLIK